MADSFSKKEKEKKRIKAKQDKLQKMQDRKSNNSKGKSLEDMLAYVDEFGNISSTPPGQAPKSVDASTISLAPNNNNMESAADTVYTGTVSFFIEAKGYGFITQDNTRENIFVHANQTLQPIKDKDKVSFEKEKTPKGFSAVRVKKIN